MFCMQVDVLENAIQKRRSMLGIDYQGKLLERTPESKFVLLGRPVEQDNPDNEAAHQQFLIHRRESQIEEVKNYVQILNALRLKQRKRKNVPPQDDPVFKILLSILRKIDYENAEERKQRREMKRQIRETRKKKYEARQIKYQSVSIYYSTSQLSFKRLYLIHLHVLVIHNV